MSMFIRMNPIANLKQIIIPLLSLTLYCFNATAQEQAEDVKLMAKQIAFDEIIAMQKGTLLVRLKTRQRTISLLNKNGQRKKAEKILEKQTNYNQDIITAFRSEFNFCPVQFFYSNYSDNIRKRNLDQIIFLNDELLPDSSIKVSDSIFFIAEISLIQQDTSVKYIDHYEIEHTENGAIRTPVYYGSADMGFQALCIKNFNFQQLSKPFPYYERTIASIPLLKKQMKTVVNNMENQLYRFLKRAIKHVTKVKSTINLAVPVIE